MKSAASLPRFHHTLRVRFADVDMQGHVFFGNYFTYMDETFMAYIDALGFAWQTLGASGLAIYYVDSGCRFRRPCLFGDRLNVHAAITELGHSSLTAEMTIVRDRNGKVVAAGYIKGVMVDTRTEKSTPIPDALRAAVAEYQAG